MRKVIAVSSAKGGVGKSTVAGEWFGWMLCIVGRPGHVMCTPTRSDVSLPILSRNSYCGIFQSMTFVMHLNRVFHC